MKTEINNLQDQGFKILATKVLTALWTRVD